MGVFALLCAFYCPAQAQDESAPVLASAASPVSLTCRESKPPQHQLSCLYRNLSEDALQNVSLKRGDEVIASAQPAGSPVSAKSQLLILVDTSDPRRAPVIEKIKQELKSLIPEVSNKFEIGLAVFDSNLRILAPMGSNTDTLLTATNTLTAVGKTTELYRSNMQAMGLLASEQHYPKFMLLMSDGWAEDTAYHHADVIRAAQAANVSIHSVGYPRSSAQTVALQTLRRLSEETGGQYFQADALTYALNLSIADVLDQEYARTGSFTISIPPPASGSDKNVTLAMRGNTWEQNKSITLLHLPAPSPVPAQAVDVDTPAQLPPPTTTPIVESPPQFSEATAETASVQPDQPVLVAEPVTINKYLYALGGLLLLGILGLLRTLREKTTRDQSAPVASPDTGRYIFPEAYLVLLDEENKPQQIMRSPWRIGRSKKNDLIIEDPSVSRYHAEIHCRRHDKFDVADVDSANGVFVNKSKVQVAPLNDGDVIEIGDISLRFSSRPLEDDENLDATAVAHTRI